MPFKREACGSDIYILIIFAKLSGVIRLY